MATFGIKTEVSFSTDKAREVFSSFYKAFSSDCINMKKPLLVNAGETETLDLSESEFIIMQADTYGMENEVLNITLNSSSESITINSTSFLFLNCLNLTSIDIENTHSTTGVNIIAVY